MTSRTLTPVIVTERHPSSRNPSRLEIWAAVSAELGQDGKPLWQYRRLELPGTPWELRRNGREAFTWRGSLTSARAATADGSALREIDRLEAEMAEATR